MLQADAQLEVKHLSYCRCDQALFHDLNFSISAGGILQIVGANGTGKTTLLRIIAGLITVEHGSLLWCGKDIQHYNSEFNKQMAYLGHQLGISLSLTPLENLQIASALHAIKTKSIDHYLDKFNLLAYANNLTGHLSAGQQRGVALACLLIRQAQLWILDEPLASLDQAGSALIEHLLIDHVNNGGLAIITTHQAISLPQLSIQRLELRSNVIPARESFDKYIELSSGNL